MSSTVINNTECKQCADIQRMHQNFNASSTDLQNT